MAIGAYIILILLDIIAFFGFGIAINMIFRRWWVSFVLYCLFLLYIVIALVHKVDTFEWVLLVIGLISVILATWGTRALKNRGYVLFS